MPIRDNLAFKYLEGNGLEIGALNTPQKLSEKAHVKYLDQYPKEKLMQLYYMNTVGMINPDIIDNGENMKHCVFQTYDFIIAGHFLEHARNLILTLKNHVDNIKSGGKLLYVVPDKRWTFDRDRPCTNFVHIDEEFIYLNDKFHDDHIRESVELIDKLKGQEAIDKFNWYKSAGFSIHVHVFTAESFHEILKKIIEKYCLRIRIIEYLSDGAEFVIVLEKL